ncbi:MAG: hypothetical protein HYR94_11075 [Chloroflexi bacterium]|nr:hypothetical protein [Chloroflexota bacterium]
MLKKRILLALTGLALLAAILGSTGFVANALGQLETPTLYACHVPGQGSGGGC